MFYSHEVLSSRKYGVATVWLVATMGKKSSAHKVTRKAILDVDVSKACHTIIAPDAPMALRLQSSLLYGVSSVYSQQCNYVYLDAQHAQSSLRTLLRPVREAQLDPKAGQARPDQLNLEDDPAFVPGLNLDILHSELLGLDLMAGPHRYMSDSASLQTAQTQVSQQLGLELLSSSSAAGGVMLPGSGSNAPGPSSLLRREDEDMLLPELDIGLDAEGNFIELDMTPLAGRGPAPRSSVLLSDRISGVGSRAESLPAGTPLDNDLPLFNDGYDLPPPEPGITSGNYRPHQSDEMVETSSTAAAPQRRKARVQKAMPLDREIELRNRDLIAMSNGYLDVMKKDWERAANGKAIAQSKKNAEFWVLGQGIAGGGLQGPLADMWSGENLYKLITGKERVAKGQKRDSEDEGYVSEERRVRPRLSDPPNDLSLGDDTMMGGYGDLEVGREGQDALEDMSSAMPWNVSASIRGSSVTRGAIGAPGSLPASLPGSKTRLGSRLISASPLVGRGVADVDTHLGGRDDVPGDAAGFGDMGLGIGSEDFELFRAAAGIDTQTAGQSQWLRTVLDQESHNFLDFIDNALGEKFGVRGEADEPDDQTREVDFEEMLPPGSNSRVVAAQALLHVLTLGTRNLIRVRQDEAFAAITMSVC